LAEHKPELYARAIEMNKRDNFVMWDETDKYRDRFKSKDRT